MNTTTSKQQFRAMNRKSKKVREAFIAELVGSHVAAQIYSMRKKERWTQKELADRIGTVQTRIPILEDPNYKNYTIQTLLSLAAAFDVGLQVRFVDFSTLEVWIANQTSAELTPMSFEEDDKRLATATQEEAATSLAQDNEMIAAKGATRTVVVSEFAKDFGPEGTKMKFSDQASTSDKAYIDKEIHAEIDKEWLADFSLANRTQATASVLGGQLA